MQKKYLEAGEIVNTHGIHGEVKVHPWCDAPEVLLDFDTLYWPDSTPVTVKRAFVHNGCVILRLDGVDTIESAEALRGKVLCLCRDEITLPDDLVFIQDILGFTVFDERTGLEIGRLRDVLTTNPAHDLYEIEREDGQKVYIPAIKPFLQRIEQDARRIVIHSIEGLVDAN